MHTHTHNLSWCWSSFSVSVCSILWSIIYNTGRMMTNYFNFCLSLKIFTYIYKCVYTLMSIIFWVDNFVFFKKLDYVSFSAYSVFAEISAAYLIGDHLKVIWHFLLAHFRIFCLCFTFESWNVICCGECLLWLYLFGALIASCAWMCMSFSRLGKVSAVISPNKLSTGPGLWCSG